MITRWEQEDWLDDVDREYQGKAVTAGVTEEMEINGYQEKAQNRIELERKVNEFKDKLR